MIFTYPNQDPDNTIIINLIEKFVKNLFQKYQSLDKMHIRFNDVLMLRWKFLSAIIEAPFLKIPNVNIGVDKQAE